MTLSTGGWKLKTTTGALRPPNEPFKTKLQPQMVVVDKLTPSMSHPRRGSGNKATALSIGPQGHVTFKEKDALGTTMMPLSSLQPRERLAKAKEKAKERKEKEKAKARMTKEKAKEKERKEKEKAKARTTKGKEKARKIAEDPWIEIRTVSPLEEGPLQESTT